MIFAAILFCASISFSTNLSDFDFTGLAHASNNPYVVSNEEYDVKFNFRAAVDVAAGKNGACVAVKKNKVTGAEECVGDLATESIFLYDNGLGAVFTYNNPQDSSKKYDLYFFCDTKPSMNVSTYSDGNVRAYWNHTQACPVGHSNTTDPVDPVTPSTNGTDLSNFNFTGLAHASSDPYVVSTEKHTVKFNFRAAVDVPTTNSGQNGACVAVQKTIATGEEECIADLATEKVEILQGKLGVTFSYDHPVLGANQTYELGFYCNKTVTSMDAHVFSNFTYIAWNHSQACPISSPNGTDPVEPVDPVTPPTNGTLADYDFTDLTRESNNPYVISSDEYDVKFNFRGSVDFPVSSSSSRRNAGCVATRKDRQTGDEICLGDLSTELPYIFANDLGVGFNYTHPTQTGNTSFELYFFCDKRQTSMETRVYDNEVLVFWNHSQACPANADPINATGDNPKLSRGSSSSSPMSSTTIVIIVAVSVFLVAAVVAAGIAVAVYRHRSAKKHVPFEDVKDHKDLESSQPTAPLQEVAIN